MTQSINSMSAIKYDEEDIIQKELVEIMKGCCSEYGSPVALRGFADRGVLVSKSSIDNLVVEFNNRKFSISKQVDKKYNIMWNIRKEN